MEMLDSNSVDMGLTSPPYDDLREYQGYSFQFKEIAKQLFRVLKPGGVLVWVVNDSTVDGCESGTSFKQALYFMQIGFNLHDTMIYKKKNPLPGAGKRYIQCFEFMFILSKGQPKTFNPILQPAKDYRDNGKKGTARQFDGSLKNYEFETSWMVPHQNIFEYKIGLYNTTSDKEAFKHPAMFPEALARDQISSWSDPGDIVLDPFMGMGTTAKMAVILERNYLGFEISEEYCQDAIARVLEAQHQGKIKDWF